MSENFQTCPGCDSLILSDTESCPECGHVLREGADSPVAATHERGVTDHLKCPNCGDSVPVGLVRCWKCNAFMREDVAERYRNLVGNPQKIIFSDLPPGERTETIPPRLSRGGYARIIDAVEEGEDEFTLRGDESDRTDFELEVGTGEAAAGESSAASTPATDSTQGSSASDSTSTEDSSDRKRTTESESSAPELNADELLKIALTQEKEADMRRRERQANMNRQRILIPCPSCGVWLRVREQQAGKSVRCRSCKAAVPVPQIRKKEKKSPKEQKPQIKLDWLEDVHFHAVKPTDIALKPGSLQNSFQTADVTFNADGLHLITLGGPPKKKSLFSRGGSEDFSQRRTENREQIQETGEFSNLPHGESHVVPASELGSIRLVQPVRHAHESMFAGVPVFGEGLIAVYLPLKLDDGQQGFCSMPLSTWRRFNRELMKAGVELPAKANGVPQADVHIAPLCHYTQAKVESLRDVVYYRNDRAFTLELTGYRCVACGIAVSEAARAKNKLGGAAGKSIAKAKCPGCSAKFGNEPLFRITKAPESDEPEAEEADSVAADVPAETV